MAPVSFYCSCQYIVCQALCKKVDTTTIRDINQKAEIFNTSFRRVHNNPI